MKKLDVICECNKPTWTVDELIAHLDKYQTIRSGEFFKSSNVDPEAEPIPEDLEFLGESQADRDVEGEVEPE